VGEDVGEIRQEGVEFFSVCHCQGSKQRQDMSGYRGSSPAAVGTNFIYFSERFYLFIWEW